MRGVYCSVLHFCVLHWALLDFEIIKMTHSINKIPRRVWRGKLILYENVARTGIEPVLPPWEGGVLTPRRTSHEKSTPGRIRTPNPLVRSQVLYPIKPRAQFLVIGCVVPIIIQHAGAQGFEPQPAEPESAVLPLDDAPISSIIIQKQGINLCPL